MAWNTKKATPAKDIQAEDYCVPSPPSDGISSLSVNDASNMLIAGSWDNSVSCYELQLGAAGNVTSAVPRMQIKHDAPVLCTAIASDGVTVFSAGCDNTVKSWNPTQGAVAQTIGQHDQPVKVMKWIPDMNVLVTGSWDKSIRVWDCRQPNPVANIPFNERIHTMDAKGQAMVVGTADKVIHVFDMKESRRISEFQSPLPYQTRVVSIFNDKNGFAIGCIEGRVGIEYFSELSKKQPSNSLTPAPRDPKGLNFVFKCHRHKREETSASSTNSHIDVYSVNDISFHPYNTFCTAGSDGTLGFWDKDARHRLRSLDRFRNTCPISCALFNTQGTLLFYAVSYDWSKGVEGNNPSGGNNIYIHNTAKEEIQPKSKK
mmetsp:Transcript_26368/g.26615  ORF Transcript_26368/g.26615 Transcript_26368/m.26615 type:complete len:373 (+) Transcript_26368:50-1168(+)|eukprot:CAMPEP_0182419906 /NCGR_PEP_ID=MMETSP1167-20130531/4248_1 /TAXON_ID=2988 /ORGANISM="Mallomonas Sp, Strain CCMP3275" /LENGTH=372 /DNA_ID=CAMNT_0024595061 /DNA_START=46 /DNA_END=1164 /DNA_ORIENTATION=-